MNLQVLGVLENEGESLEETRFKYEYYNINDSASRRQKVRLSNSLPHKLGNVGVERSKRVVG